MMKEFLKDAMKDGMTADEIKAVLSLAAEEVKAEEPKTEEKVEEVKAEETPAEEDFAEEKQRRTEELSNILGGSVATAQILVANGFLSLEGLSELSEEDLRAIQGLSGEDADAILEKIAQAKS